MSRVLLEGGIIILLVLIGISVFVPSDSGVSDVIIEFENSIGSGNLVEDGEIDNVEVSIEDNSNFISRLNGKIANTIVNGLNSVLEIGVRVLRHFVN